MGVYMNKFANVFKCPKIQLDRDGQDGARSVVPVSKPVRFKKEPFFDVLATLVEPKGLKTSGREGWQQVHIPFRFETQHVHLLHSTQADSSQECNVQVHLRFGSLNAKSEQDDRYPSDLAVEVNDRFVALPEPVTFKITGGATKRVQLPINIVSSCFVSSTVTNVLGVTWRPVRGHEFAVGLFLVKKRSVATIVSALQREKAQRVALTTAMVKKKMERRASSDEVVVTKLHVSLTCPLSRTRMKVPCRARSCKHLDCFDAFNYLQVNEWRPAWLCPVCGNRAALSSLVVDQLFVDIIASVPDDCESVIFREDGSWTPSTSQRGLREWHHEFRDAVFVNGLPLQHHFRSPRPSSWSGGPASGLGLRSLN
nr:E3 SUMO-protein ligase PIAS1-like [Rhipicephalus microplus]